LCDVCRAGQLNGQTISALEISGSGGGDTWRLLIMSKHQQIRRTDGQNAAHPFWNARGVV
jgi:hypothetical protein